MRLSIPSIPAASVPVTVIGRRECSLLLAAALSIPQGLNPVEASALGRGLVSSAVPDREFSNSILASRDTNISPREIYDFLRTKKDLRPEAIVGTGGRDRASRALDLGAGAGASTQVLWDAGWEEVVAVDVSRLAWDRFASRDLPSGVQFFHASDDQYVAKHVAQRFEPYDLVVINYAVNKEKAVQLAKTLLAPGGRLLAPSNEQTDYWFAQSYLLLDQQGSVFWSQGTLGAYDVLFQPDFTSPTCQGQWCPRLRSDGDVAKLRL